MSTEQVGLIIAIFSNIATVTGVLVAVFRAKQTTSERLAKIEFMTTTLWDFHMRRAGGEMVRKNFGTLDSPLDIQPEILHWFDPLCEELQAFYLKVGRPDMSDRDLAIEIERAFGGRMLKEICIPHDIHQGECLLIAVAVAKGGSTVELPDVSLKSEEAETIAQLEKFK